MEKNIWRKEDKYNDGLEQTVAVWLLTMDCCSQLKSQLSKSAGNMATASNSPPCLELGPSLSKLVDKTGSRGKIWNYFADRADKNKYPVSSLQPLSKSSYKAYVVTKYMPLTSVHLGDHCAWKFFVISCFCVP